MVDERALLDPTLAIQPAALADLALERALAGGHWLAGVLRQDGSFYYEYDPDDDTYEATFYNEVRHAGTAYSLFQIGGATGDSRVLDTARAAVAYIDASSITQPRGRAYIHDGSLKLGGQALAIVAVLEGRRVLATDGYDPLVRDLGRFLLTMERRDDPGHYFHYFADGRRLAEPSSDFYPGETLLALARLAADFPEAPYRQAAVRAADYLVHRRDGNLIEIGRVPYVDHWLTIGLADLYRVVPDPDYKTVVDMQAEAVIDELWGPDDDYPGRSGGSRKYVPIDFTTTATRGEALVAAWSLAIEAGDEAAAQRYAEAARRVAQFAMRNQYMGHQVDLFPVPERTRGGWSADVADQDIRIDYVQHNASALVGVWHLTRDEEIPAVLDRP